VELAPPDEDPDVIDADPGNCLSFFRCRDLVDLRQHDLDPSEFGAGRILNSSSAGYHDLALPRGIFDMTVPAKAQVNMCIPIFSGSGGFACKRGGQHRVADLKLDVDTPERPHCRVGAGGR